MNFTQFQQSSLQFFTQEHGQQYALLMKLLGKMPDGEDKEKLKECLQSLWTEKIPMTCMEHANKFLKKELDIPKMRQVRKAICTVLWRKCAMCFTLDACSQP